MCVYMSVYVCECMCVCVWVRIYECACLWVCMCMGVCTWMCMYVYVCVCVWMCVRGDSGVIEDNTDLGGKVRADNSVPLGLILRGSAVRTKGKGKPLPSRSSHVWSCDAERDDYLTVRARSKRFLQIPSRCHLRLNSLARRRGWGHKVVQLSDSGLPSLLCFHKPTVLQNSWNMKNVSHLRDSKGKQQLLEEGALAYSVTDLTPKIQLHIPGWRGLTGPLQYTMWKLSKVKPRPRNFCLVCPSISPGLHGPVSGVLGTSQ